MERKDLAVLDDVLVVCTINTARIGCCCGREGIDGELKLEYLRRMQAPKVG